MSENEENLSLFREEAEELLGEVIEALLLMDSVERASDLAEQIHRIFRAVHTIKGLASMCELEICADFAHRLENVLSVVREQNSLWSPAMSDHMFAAIDYLKMLVENQDRVSPTDSGLDLLVPLEELADSTVASDSSFASPTSVSHAGKLKSGVQSLRISGERLDRLVEVVGEIVVSQCRLSQMTAALPDGKWTQPVDEMGRLVESLREVALNIRMMPVGNIFRTLTRVVRDLAAKLGKEVSFVTSGGETELDKAVLDCLLDPLLHLVRNSLDHGIRTPEDRIAVGKPARAMLSLSATHEAGQVIITLSDDGEGIPLESVRRGAVEMGLLRPDQMPAPPELYALLFTPGFSTKSEVTEYSGRGVGLDVVKRQVDALRGNVEIQSEAGVGTTVTLRLPLTLAIIDGLLVEVHDARYVLPLASVRECLDFESPGDDRLTRIIRVRTDAVPYIDAREIFDSSAAPDTRNGTAILLEHGPHRFALIVDRVLGDLQAVVKSIGSLFRQVSLVSGATVLGDGGIALILDPLQLSRRISQSKSLSKPAVPEFATA